jgi:hypothetical protein
LGLDNPKHGSVEDGGELHEGIFEKQGNVRVFPDLFLDVFYVFLENNPTPGDVGNYLDGGKV